MPRSASNLSGDQQTPGLFTKVGMNMPFVHMGMVCGALSEIQLQTRDPPSILGTQELSKEAATAQGWAQWSTCHPSHSLLSLRVPSWHSAFPGGGGKAAGVTAPQGSVLSGYTWLIQG